jgi:hypothetical protein
MLIMGFTLPIFDAKMTENIKNFGANFVSTTIRDKLVHGSPFTNLVFKGIVKLSHSLQRVHTDEVGVTADKELSKKDARAKCRSVTLEGISGNCFLTAFSVESRKRRLVSVTYSVAEEWQSTAVLSSIVECAINYCSRSVKEELAQGFRIEMLGNACPLVDGIFIDDNRGHCGTRMDGLRNHDIRWVNISIFV